MSRVLFLLVVTLCVLFLMPAQTMAATASDEFSGAAGSPPNPAIWGYDLGGGGWGNNEQQVYTNSTANARLDGQGRLVIQAIKSGTGYTSARLVTRGKFTFTYGTVEARIQFPAGAGLNSAFWTLGANIGTVGWPNCGEIDVNELVGDGANYHSAVHGPGMFSPWTRSVLGSVGTNLSTGFHTYSLQKSAGYIAIRVDGQTVGTLRKSDMAFGEQWVFDAPAYLLLNIAVGGNWTGPPNATTPNPATMLVDWVRYTQG